MEHDDYIKRVFSKTYNGFNYEEAVANVGVSFDVFKENIHKNKIKIETINVDESIYNFTLYCCYITFAYPIKVIISPSLFAWISAKYSEMGNNFDKIVISCKSKYTGRISSTLANKNESDRKLLNLIVNYIKTLDINDVANKDEIVVETRNVKDFVFTAKREDYTFSVIAYLSKLFICLIDDDIRSNNNDEYHFPKLEPEHKQDIVNIAKAFNLFTKRPSLNDYSKKWSKANDMNPYLLSTDEIYLNNGKNRTLIPLSKEILNAIGVK
jgi:hypothetical protein